MSPSEKKRINVVIPEDWANFIRDLMHSLEKLGIKSQSDLIRVALKEFAERRGLYVPDSDLQWGGDRNRILPHPDPRLASWDDNDYAHLNWLWQQCTEFVACRDKDETIYLEQRKPRIKEKMEGGSNRQQLYLFIVHFKHMEGRRHWTDRERIEASKMVKQMMYGDHS